MKARNQERLEKIQLAQELDALKTDRDYIFLIGFFCLYTSVLGFFLGILI